MNKIIFSILAVLLVVVIFTTGFVVYKNYSVKIQKSNYQEYPIKPDTKIITSTTNNVVLSPRKGDIFIIGKSSIKIKWDTSKIDAYHIDIVPGENNKDASQYVSIYGWNPQPPLDGEFVYTYLDVRGGFLPGNYKIKLQPKDKSITYYSDEFTVASPVAFVPKSDKMFYIESLIDNHLPNQHYNRDDTLYVTVDTREGDGSYATPEKGFTLAVGIFDVDENGQMTSGRSLQTISPEDSLKYDETQHLWKIGAGPFTSLECNQWHVLRVEITCSHFDVSSYCVQRYMYYPGKVLPWPNNIEANYNFYVSC